MTTKDCIPHRLERVRAPSVASWEQGRRFNEDARDDAVVDCGWGRLLFGQSFGDLHKLAAVLQEERPDKRDVALYLRDPHVVLSYAPQDLFLDPSHTFRLYLERYQHPQRRPKGFFVHLLSSREDAEAINRLYISRRMVPPGVDFIWDNRTSKVLHYWVAEDDQDGSILGAVNGVDHVAAFALKNKNAYNEPLFMGKQPEANLNPYATIIVTEARRRGIGVEVIDAEDGYFALILGGRRIVCRESLSELTTAVAMSRCDDKTITHRLLKRNGLPVPEQTRVEALDQAEAFLSRMGSVVVKPARGEQGAGISVDVRDPDILEKAIMAARRICDTVIPEEYVEGDDLRIVVIDFEVVAAAMRCPAQVTGTGQHNIRDLIQAQSRRRRAATGGESAIPLDDETERCVGHAGYALNDVLPEGEVLVVRKTANLHTGGTIHDVTADLHPKLAEDACAAARVLDIPVTGLDFIVPSVSKPDYVIIEANERPGLANHEPRPTAERFVDLLFPMTANREAVL